MRILHVNTERTWRGGEQQVAWLVEGLMQLGEGRHTLAVVPGGALEARARKAGWEVEPLAMRRGWSPATARRLGEIVRRGKFDLVHAHTAHAHTLAWLGVARHGLAPVIATRRVDFEIAQGPLRFFRRKKFQHPGIHLIAISSAVREALVRGGAPPERITLVPSGIDPGRLRAGRGESEALREEIGAGAKTLVIGNVGALTDHKGQIYLLRAADHLRRWFFTVTLGSRSLPYTDFRVVLVGEGEDRPKLEEEIRRLHLEDKVLLAGFRSDVAGWYGAFDLYCVASHLEGLGTSMLDAMWMRLPLAATRTGGIVDAIQHEQNGLLVPPRDEEALARALIRLIDEPGLARRLGDAAHNTVESRFTVDRMVEGNLAVYHQILSSRRA